MTVVDEVRCEMGTPIEPPLRKVGVVAIVKNEFAGTRSDDLSSSFEASVELGTQMGNLGVATMRPYPVESYGKGAIVGLNGEQEHGVALLTTSFGNALRATVGGGSAWISSATKRAQPGATIDVPLAFKDALYVRSHYDAMTITLHDAPLPDEIAVICCFANRGRPLARVGGLRAADVVGADGLV